MAFEFAQLSAARLQSLSTLKTVFFFPVGGLEDHGPHLPMGLDLMEAQRLCVMAAERLEREMPGWTAILMPPAPLGVEPKTGKVSLGVRGYVLRDYLVDSCRALGRAGFAHFVAISGELGPKQLTAIEEAGRLVGRGFFRRRLTGTRLTLVSASSTLVSGRDVLRSPMGAASEHGGARDTSVALALEPSLVDPSYSSLPEITGPSGGMKRWLGRLTRIWQSGYWGAPARASSEEGARVLTGTMDEIFPKLRAVWEGSNPTVLFRSWYAVVPLHRSFYKAWLLTVILTTVMVIWLYLMVDQLTPR